MNQNVTFYLVFFILFNAEYLNHFDLKIIIKDLMLWRVYVHVITCLCSFYDLLWRVRSNETTVQWRLLIPKESSFVVLQNLTLAINCIQILHTYCHCFISRVQKFFFLLFLNIDNARTISSTRFHFKYLNHFDHKIIMRSNVMTCHRTMKGVNFKGTILFCTAIFNTRHKLHTNTVPYKNASLRNKPR